MQILLDTRTNLGDKIFKQCQLMTMKIAAKKLTISAILEMLLLTQNVIILVIVERILLSFLYDTSEVMNSFIESLKLDSTERTIPVYDISFIQEYLF